MKAVGGQVGSAGIKIIFFGLNAVDSAPGISADTYASIDDCIRSFMKEWMDEGYLDSSDWRNHGTYLGIRAAELM